VIVRHDQGRTLFGIVDALGHGQAAHHAAQLAVAYLEKTALEPGLDSLLRGVHQALRGSRGAAATFGLFEAGTLWMTAVGNVELRRVGGGLSLLNVPGILGERLHTPRVSTDTLHPGQRLVMFSDGISSRANLDEVAAMSGSAACAHLLARSGRHHDDASILVIDVVV
jgi:negative regulator of sigma-B (phosphoserine phosphatase)